MKQASYIMNENELIEKAKNGDRTALTELVKKYEKTVYNFAFKFCRNKEKAENTMQETFVSMIKSIGTFGGKSKLSTWLYTVVSNHCLMQARGDKTHLHSSIHDEDTFPENKEIAHWDISPDKAAENSELKMVLDEAILKLEEDYRIVFLLRDVEGFSTEETGKMMGLSVPAVKSRLHRARAFLRNEINKKFEK